MEVRIKKLEARLQVIYAQKFSFDPSEITRINKELVELKDQRRKEAVHA